MPSSKYHPSKPGSERFAPKGTWGAIQAMTREEYTLMMAEYEDSK